MLRSLIEQLSRGKVIRRRMPSELGGRPLFLSPDSALSYLRLDWAHASGKLLSAVKKYVSPGDNVWDIGGNVGVFAFAAAHIAGPDAETVCIEADPFLASLLQRTAIDPGNSDLRVNVICAAVSSEAGIARFMIANRGRSSNSLEQASHRSPAGGTRYVQYVPTITLDSLLAHFSRPSIIKIDVEGAEPFVLKGATRLLADVRPVFYIEVGSEQNADVTDLFKRHQYRLFDGDAEHGKELERCSYNTLAVPSEASFRRARA